MIGAIPALLTYYWRMQMPETARYTVLVAKNAKQATTDMQVLGVHIAPEEEEEEQAAQDDGLVGTDDDQYGLFSREFCRRHGIHLIGTTVCWFVLDVTFYSLNLFMKDIFTVVGVLPRPNKPGNQVKRMIRATGLHTAVALGGNLPGYFFAVAFIDRIGRIKIQLLGFTMMTVFTLCLAIPYEKWREPKNGAGFVVMYGFTFFFANFGPNTTTFILPAEIFPARLRSTCHGISGAVGKLGAIIGVLAFSFMETHYKALLFVLVGCNLVGIVFTLLLPETKGKSLEDITGETEECQQPLDDKDAVVNVAQGIHAVSI
jgi:PHS family inorganic phosphate transporter-like MFS transporter